MDEVDSDLIWTDTSNQFSSSDSDTTTPTKMDESNEDSDLEKKFKNELKQHIFKEPKLENDCDVNSKKKKKKEKLNFTIKSEPESDLESIKNKKKSKRKSSINGSHNEELNANDSYMELRIKEEAVVSPTDSSRKHKKKKREKHESFSQNDTHSESTLEDSDVKRKSNKKKKHKYEEEKQEPAVEDLFSAEETIVGTYEVEDENTQEKQEPAVEDLFSAEETIVGTYEVEDENTKEKQEPAVEDLFSAEETIVGTYEVEDENTQQKKHKKKKKKKRDTSPIITQNGYHTDQEDGADEVDDAMNVDDSHNNVQHNNISTVSSAKLQQSRISERLLFEDDSQMETILDNSRNSLQSFKLQQFIKSQGNIQPCDITYPDEVSISPDDEVFLLHCPTEVDISFFEDISLLLDSTCRLKLGGQKYESNIDRDNGNNVTLLLFEDQKHKIKSFPCEGTINFRKRLPKAHFVMDNIIENKQTNFIPLPDTKCRHPLFGPDYKKAIKLPAAIKERLQNEATQDETPHKKKKKKQKLEKEDHTVEDEEKKLEGKERRKRRRSSRGDDEVPSSKQSRPPPAWDDEQAIEHNLFDY